MSNLPTLKAPRKPVLSVDTRIGSFPSAQPLLATSKIPPLNLYKTSVAAIINKDESFEGFSDFEDGGSWADSTEVSSLSRASSVYSMDEIKFLEVDPAHNVADVEPLSIQCFVHAISQHRYQLLVRITAKRAPVRASNCINGTQAMKKLHESPKKSVDIFLTAQLAGFPMNPSTTGELRLVSDFQLDSKQVTAYLFERSVVILATSSDGFDDILSVFDLEASTTVVGRSPLGLLIRDDKTEFDLVGENEVISVWLALVNDTSHLPFMSLSFGNPTSLCRPESTTLDLVVCTPIGYVSSIIPGILNAMGPQDRLAVVVVTTDGSTGWIHLHKLSWSKWSEITKLDLESLYSFNQSSSPVLETARKLLKIPTLGRQQSILIVTGCPLATTTVSLEETVHVVGIGTEYDVDMMTSLAQQSGNGRFYHADSITTLSSCCGSIVTADKTYLHHKAVLTIRLAEEAVATKYKKTTRVPLKDDVKHNEVVLPVGGLIAGQSHVSIMEVDTDCLQLGQTLAECSITSTSALTGRRQLSISRAIVENEVTPPIATKPVFFDRLLLVCSDILKECLLLASESQFQAIIRLLGETAENIFKVTRKATKLKTDDAKELASLCEPDHTYEALILKSRQLARSLIELQGRVNTCYRSSVTVARALLYEASQVLETQYAISSKTPLEGLFFEDLDCNFI